MFLHDKLKEKGNRKNEKNQNKELVVPIRISVIEGCC
jgi:hypothetical protein